MELKLREVLSVISTDSLFCLYRLNGKIHRFVITANNAFLHSSLPHFDRALLLFPAAAADNAIRAAVERGENGGG